ncbi:MAG: KxYKxGKxW signal peptide domain-containing protein, partial [Streptococcus thermophilus]
MKNIYKIFTSEKKRYALHKSHKMWVTIAISATGAIIPFLLSATPASVVSLTPVIYASTLSRTVTISPSQFGDAFQRNGVTNSYPYDTNNSIQTLTLDQHN